MNDGDFATARERALVLQDWLEAGGFYPPNYTEVEVRGYLANVLRRTVGLEESEEESREATPRPALTPMYRPKSPACR